MAKSLENEMINQEEDTQKGKFLTFVIGNESYAIEIKNVTEIIGLQPITEMPELPEYIKGIINLRGKIIPLMDVRLRFKKPVRDYDNRTCVIVINIESITIGLIVDSVSEVTAIPDSDIVVPPDINKTNNNFIKGIGKVNSEVKLILDCGKLLNEKECENISNM